MVRNVKLTSYRPLLVQKDLSNATRCMLYSAQVKWVSPERVFVAAGTAFGMVVVWSYSFDACPSSLSVQTHDIFVAHPDGAVFGVCLFQFPSKSLEAREKLYIATCSDDRTIKLWGFTASLEARYDHKVSEVSEEETGRLPEPNLEHGQASMGSYQQPLCHMTVPPGNSKLRQGHLSRIWRVGLLDSLLHTEVSYLSSHTLASLGEDATCQLWDIHESTSADGAPVLQLRHLKTFLNHAGKNLWCMAQYSPIDGRRCICTGGADGQIISHAVESVLESREPHNQLGDSLPMGLKSYVFIGPCFILATTSGGDVLIGRPAEDSGSHPILEWESLGAHQHLRGFSIAAGIEASNVGFVAGSAGTVLAYAGSRLLNFPRATISGEKIGGLFSKAINAPATFRGPDTVLLTCGLNSDQALICLLNTDADHDSVFLDWSGSAERNSYHVQLQAEFVVTSIECAFVADSRILLLLGSRDGRVARCQLWTENSTTTRPISPQNVNMSHRDAVTSIMWQFANNIDYGHVLTTSRDGTYCIHRYSILDEKADPLKVHQLSLPFGPYIEGAYLYNDSELCFFGFQSEDFVVFNETLQQEVARVDCGGAHRIWAFQAPKTSAESGARKGTFAWNRNSQFNIQSIPGESHTCLQNGGHGREIKASSICPVPYCVDGDTVRLIATAAEDTDIRFFTYPITGSGRVTATIRCTTVIRKHDTGIQQMRWSSSGCYLFTCGGREEFMVWRIRQVPFVKVGIVCESVMPVEASLPDLRIMDFDLIDETEEDTNLFEARFRIVMALSNGTIRVSGPPPYIYFTVS